MVDWYHFGRPTPVFPLSWFPQQIQWSLSSLLHEFVESSPCLPQQVRGAVDQIARKIWLGGEIGS